MLAIKQDSSHFA